MKTFLTLDYELYMGPIQGSVYKSLIIPVSHLLEVLNPLGIKATFFIDAAYLYRLNVLAKENEKAAIDFEAIREHLRFLEQNGHSIQMHFHPQWIYSDLENNGWIMDYDHYKISDMSQNDFDFFFKESYELLQSLTDKPVCAYRAGGYSLGDRLECLKLFRSLGLYIDSSVLRGGRSETRFQCYDYRFVPDKGHYSFERVLSVETNGGSFVEYPISTIIVNPVRYLFIKRRCSKKDITNKWGDGVGVANRLTKTQRIKSVLYSLTAPKVIPASVDYPFSGVLEKNYYYSVSKGYSEFVIIGHPKNLTPGSLCDLQRFVEKHPEMSFNVFSKDIENK